MTFSLGRFSDADPELRLVIHVYCCRPYIAIMNGGYATADPVGTDCCALASQESEATTFRSCCSICVRMVLVRSLLYVPM